MTHLLSRSDLIQKPIVNTAQDHSLWEWTFEEMIIGAYCGQVLRLILS